MSIRTDTTRNHDLGESDPTIERVPLELTLDATRNMPMEIPVIDDVATIEQTLLGC